MKISVCSAVLLVLGIMVPTAQAASLLIQNHSFESPSTDDGTFIASDTSAPPGWEIYGSTEIGFRFFGVLDPAGTTLYSDPVPDGENVGVVFFFTAGSNEGGLEQTLGDHLELNTTYTLTVDVGNIANDSNPPHSSFSFGGFPGYRIELLAGGTVIASDDNTLFIDEGLFERSSVQFTTGSAHALAGQALGVRLIHLNGSGIEVNFDNVILDAVAIPEPSACGLAAGSALVLLGLVRRRM